MAMSGSTADVRIYMTNSGRGIALLSPISNQR
jgi:hypothetical protein